MSEINFEQYQIATSETAIYPGALEGNSDALAYVALGLTGEAGEIANKVKKILRDKGGMITSEDRTDLSKELGDVLWYLARLADEIGYPLEAIAQNNVDKLRSRQERGVLSGSGDNR
jgi:NTP pyrophosphatase (non-canonical NTP hydrolase)